MNLTQKTAAELARLIRDREASSVEVVRAHLERIERLARLNAVVTLDAEGALAAARRADEAIAAGSTAPLRGVPFTLKDMHATQGIRTTGGLAVHADHVPQRDSVVAERLKAAGAILLGKTNMALNVESDGELFGRPLNPYDEARTTGGSSGGAGAAIAARLTPLDVGTDMTGSVRMPAHYCGVVGLKPSSDRVPQDGMVWLPRMDLPRVDRWLGVSGPMARSVEDCALAFGVLAGADPRDPAVPPLPSRAPGRRDPASLRIAFAPSIEGVVCSKEQRAHLVAAAEKLSKAGAVVEEAQLPVSLDELLDAFRALMQIPLSVMAEAAPPGTSLSAAEALRILDRRDGIIRRVETFLEGYDAWLSPTCPDVAFPHRPLGEPVVVDGEELSSQCIDHPCIPATLTGAPAMVVPVSLTDAGLPVGAQLMGRRWNDEALLDVGAAVAEVVGAIAPPPV